MMLAMPHLNWPTITVISLGVLLATDALASLSGHGLIYRLYSARTYHFREVAPGMLYRDGMRNPIQFARSCRRAGIKTVVSVIGYTEVTSERFSPAIEECQSNGIKNECLGVNIGGWPDTQAIRQFLAIVADPQRRPVLIHCREGVRRTGMVVAAYQMSIMGYTREQAKAAMEQFGHSARTVADVQRFIELYDASDRSIRYDFDTRVAGAE